MGVIKVQGIKLYGYHGCLDEEGIIGTDYTIDVIITADLNSASVSDKLNQTVDYVTVSQIVKEQVAIRSKLIEHVCKRIIDELLATIEMIETVEVHLSKIHPPIPVDVERVTVVLEGKRKVN